MTYKVIDYMPFYGNTIAIIEGKGKGLKNDIMINDGKYHILSIAFVNNKNFDEQTTIVIEGNFDEEYVEI